jgi:hypothetical protein
VTSDLTLRAVFLEDAAAIFGDVIAFAGLGLDQLTGSSIPQGVAAVLIGVVMIRIGLRLIQRSHDFLVGAWVFPGGAEAAIPATSRRPSDLLTRTEHESFSLNIPVSPPSAKCCSPSSARTRSGSSPESTSTTA